MIRTGRRGGGEVQPKGRLKTPTLQSLFPSPFHGISLINLLTCEWHDETVDKLFLWHVIGKNNSK